MKLLLHLIILSITISSCKKEEEIEEVQSGIIEDQTFNSTLLIDGHKYDGTIIRNCIFECRCQASPHPQSEQGET